MPRSKDLLLRLALAARRHHAPGIRDGNKGRGGSLRVSAAIDPRGSCRRRFSLRGEEGVCDEPVPDLEMRVERRFLCHRPEARVTRSEVFRNHVSIVSGWEV